MTKQGLTRYHDLMTSKAASFKIKQLAVNLVISISMFAKHVPVLQRFI